MEVNINIVSSIGLISDIVGVLILFVYGLPSKIEQHNLVSFSGTKEPEHVSRKNRKVKRWAYVGLSLLLLGFILQLIGTNVTWK